MASTARVSRDRSALQWPADADSIVRQPILDGFGVRHGYQLLFKTSRNDPRDASPDALRTVDHIVLFGLERLTANSPAFLPCAPEMLTEDLQDLLPAPMTVLEISGAIGDSPELLGICRNLRKVGFRFALLERPDIPEPNHLLDLLQYVKIDFARLEARDAARARRRPDCCTATLIATGIHSQNLYLKAHAEGFEYFQGFYFCSPQPVQHARIPVNHLAYMQILRELLNEPLELSTLCPLVKGDPSLVYRVLRRVNSAAYVTREPINSIEAAILVLGDTAFRRIAAVAIGAALTAGRSSEILHTALVRAQFCASAARLANLDANDQYLLGLLSLLPGMLGVPMEMIAPELPLRGTVSQALLGIPVHERCLLDWIECHESDQRLRCRTIEYHYKLDPVKVMQAYVEALAWDRAELNLVA